MKNRFQFGVETPAATGLQCPICDSLELRQVRRYSNKGTTCVLWACRGCEVWFWDPRIEAGSDFYSGENVSLYSDIHSGNVVAATEPRFQRFFSRFSSDQPSRILDVGCGSGTFLGAAQALGHDVWGIDFDPISVRCAKERGIEHVYCQPLQTFLDQHREIRFDHITAFDVLEHLVDPMTVLKCLLEMLVPGGTLTVTVPNRKRLLANQMSSDFPPHHFFRFDMGSLTQTLVRAGYANATAEAFQYGYLGPTALNALVKGVRKIAFSGEGIQTTCTGPIEATASNKRIRSNGKVKHFWKKCVAATVAPSAQIERLLGRGFKIFATAHRPFDSHANDTA